MSHFIHMPLHLNIKRDFGKKYEIKKALNHHPKLHAGAHTHPHSNTGLRSTAHEEEGAKLARKRGQRKRN